jgi:hypothetical protein
VVKYQAGTYVELTDGFVSGTDFVAEINPCVSTITVIASKTDYAETLPQEHQQTETTAGSNWLTVYPNILPSGNSITIKANENIDGVELRMFDLQGKHIRSFRLNDLMQGASVSVPLNDLPGLYVLKAQDGSHSFTQKIVLQ